MWIKRVENTTCANGKVKSLQPCRFSSAPGRHFAGRPDVPMLHPLGFELARCPSRRIGHEILIATYSTKEPAGLLAASPWRHARHRRPARDPEEAGEDRAEPEPPITVADEFDAARNRFRARSHARVYAAFPSAAIPFRALRFSRLCAGHSRQQRRPDRLPRHKGSRRRSRNSSRLDRAARGHLARHGTRRR